MKELAKHILRDVLDYALKYQTTEKQRAEHAKRQIQQNIDSKLAMGTLKEDDAEQYRLDLMILMNDNDKEVIQEEITRLEKKIRRSV